LYTLFNYDLLIFFRFTMAAGEEALEAQLKGLSKHFNSVTVRGRANVS